MEPDMEGLWERLPRNMKFLNTPNIPVLSVENNLLRDRPLEYGNAELVSELLLEVLGLWLLTMLRLLSRLWSESKRESRDNNSKYFKDFIFHFF